jgi:HEAT repeat protein/thiol-disulfide isomerase/thioredoxin
MNRHRKTRADVDRKASASHSCSLMWHELETLAAFVVRLIQRCSSIVSQCSFSARRFEWRCMYLFLLGALCLIPSLGFAQETPAFPPKADDASTEAFFDDLEKATTASLLNRKPILAIFGAEWCGWCRQLESDLATDAATTIRQDWTIVRIDVEKQPDLALDMEVNGVPALRLLGFENQVLAGADGYLPIPELHAWLDEHRDRVDPEIQRILAESETPSETDLAALVTCLSHRTPSLRNAAVQRLLPYRNETASTMIDTLQHGSLASKLSALSLLKSWQAPVGSIDPWEPDSVNSDSIQVLLGWKDQLPSEPSESAPAWPTDELAPEKAKALLDQFFESPTPDREFEILKHPRAMLPLVAARLQTATELSDQNHERLRQIHYALLASGPMRLQQAPLIQALANLNSETHRKSAELLLATLTKQDQALLDHLAIDPDPIIRELTIPKLEELKLLDDEARLRRMLADSSPSVRTAILKCLAEQPDPACLTILIEYLAQESDEDLLIYATKTLGLISAEEAGAQAKAETSLIELIQHDSWRVRAAAIDSVAEIADKHQTYINGTRQSRISRAMVEAVFAATKDADPFVVSRVEALVMNVCSEKTVDLVAEYLLENAERFKALTSELSAYESQQLFPMIAAQLEKVLDSEDSKRKHDATLLIAEIDPSALEEQLGSLLQSPDAQFRIAGLSAVLSILKKRRDSELEVDDSSSFRRPNRIGTSIEPWFEVPAEWQVDAPKRSDDQDAGSDDQELVSQPPARSGWNAFFSTLFGGDLAEPASAPKLELKPIDTAPPTPIETNETAEKKLNAVDDFFGLSSESTDAAIESKESQTNLDPADADSPLSAIDEAELDLDGLPSTWMDEWRKDLSRRQEIGWFSEVDPIVEKAFSDAETFGAKTLSERGWWQAVALAFGQETFSEQITELLMQKSDELPSNDRVRFEEMVLPWLRSQDRIAVAQSWKIDWQSIKKTDYQRLYWLTEVDDPAIADWIVQKGQREELKVEEWASVQEVVLKALLGKQADSLPSHIYESSSSGFSSFDEPQAIPGKLRAITWLRQQFFQTSSPSERAFYLSSLSLLDHWLAVQTSIGYLSQPHDPSDESQLLESATVLALADKNQLSVDRAAKWMMHPLSYVRRMSLDRLCLNNRSFLEEYDSPLRLLTVYAFDPILPGCWYLKEPIEAIAFQPFMTSEEEPKCQRRARIVASISQSEADISTLVDGPVSKDPDRILLSTALAAAGRVDGPVVEVYQAVSETLEDPDEAKLFYQIIQPLKGDSIRSIRTKLRERFGTEIVDRN